MCAEKAAKTLHSEEVAQVSVGRLIAGGALSMFLSCLFVVIFLPFLAIYIVPAGIFLIVYMAWSLAFGELASRQAQALAKKHLGANGKSELHVVEQVGDGAALVLNDWGMVFCSAGKKPVELSWNEVIQVEEPQAKVLLVHGYNNTEFKMNLTVAHRFFLVTASMFAKIPSVCEFDINPLTGESRLLAKLHNSPRQWKGLWGRFIVNANGVQFNDKQIHFDLLQKVDETVADADPDPGVMGKIWTLHFYSVNDYLAISSSQLEADYQIVKRIVSEKCPTRVSFATNAKTPQDIAYDEFCWLREILGSVTPLNKRKAAYFERYYSYMLILAKRFKFKFYPEVRKFLDDYAYLLRFDGRESAAKELDELVF